ncbi:MAG: hypothetical protein Kow0090_06960 [Myxococcota bacterium]
MPRKNGCELEIDLFCKGMRIPKDEFSVKGKGITRTRAGLGSGLELIIKGELKDIYVNVPIKEKFAESSPYVLKRNGYDYIVEDTRDGEKYKVALIPTPSWYDKKTFRGTAMSRIAVMQGTYLAVYIGDVCSFWKMSPQKRCKFCTTGVNVGSAEENEKRAEEVVEVALAAKAENKITFVHFNSGYHEDCGVELVAPYVRAIKRDVGALVGVQLVPDSDLSKYDRLIDMGVEHFSFCYEFHNPEYFERYLPGKFEYLTQRRFFDAMEYTSKKLGRGRVSGEIIAGIEPLEDTFKAIDYITSIGAFPTICIFRPLIGAELETANSPNYEAMLEVFKYAAEALRKNGIPIGLAPNLEVSLVVLPTDAMELAPKTPALKRYLLKNKLLKTLAYPYFKYRMRKYDPGVF